MEDEQTASVEDGAPVATDNAASENGAPATSPPEGFIEQDRYENLRKEFNQRNALIDRAKSGDNDALRELIGAEFAQDEEDPDLGDEEQESFQDPRVDALIQEREQERETAILRDVSGHIDTLLTEASIELPQRLKQAILSEAWLRGGGAQIQPNTTEEVVKEWLGEYKAMEQAAGDRYVASKRAPHVSKGGTGATETPYRDDMSLRELTQAAVEQARLANQD